MSRAGSVGDPVAERLAELRAELGKGRQELARLEHQRGQLRDTVLRISGAIQVLEELQERDAVVGGP